MNAGVQDHCYITEEADGSIHAVSPSLSMTVLPVDGRPGKIFNRNGIKKHLDGRPVEHVRWLVGELNGVRVYIHQGAVIMTTEDLYP